MADVDFFWLLCPKTPTGALPLYLAGDFPPSQFPAFLLLHNFWICIQCITGKWWKFKKSIISNENAWFTVKRQKWM